MAYNNICCLGSSGICLCKCCQALEGSGVFSVTPAKKEAVADLIAKQQGVVCDLVCDLCSVHKLIMM